MRKDDPAYGVKGRPAPLDKKGFPVGGNIETDDDTGFNRQLPPGQYIQDQMYANAEKRIAALKPKSTSGLLSGGTKGLD